MEETILIDLCESSCIKELKESLECVRREGKREREEEGRGGFDHLGPWPDDNDDKCDDSPAGALHAESCPQDSRENQAPSCMSKHERVNDSENKYRHMHLYTEHINIR